MRGSKLLLRQSTRAGNARDRSPFLAKLQVSIGHQKADTTCAPRHSVTRHFSQFSKPSLDIQEKRRLSASLPTGDIGSLDSQRRLASSSPIVKEAKSIDPPLNKDLVVKETDEGDDEADSRGFARSEKASQAAQVNLSARLAKDGKSADNSLGAAEVWRLLRIARPEAKWLGGMYLDPEYEAVSNDILAAFVFLLTSSSISVSIP